MLLQATPSSTEAFHNGREFSVYLDLAPQQYSSGGKTNFIGMSRNFANKMRSSAGLKDRLKEGARRSMISLPIQPRPVQGLTV